MLAEMNTYHASNPSLKADTSSEPGTATRVNDSEGSNSLRNVESRISDLRLQFEQDIQASNAEISKLQNHLVKFERLLGFTSLENKDLEWRRIGSNQVVQETDLPEGYLNKIILLPRDVYSIVATFDCSFFAFWMGLLIIFGFQFSLLVLLLLNQVGVEDDNPLGTPAKSK